MAFSEPIKVQRRSGDSFVVLSERHYRALIHELIYLQRTLLSRPQVNGYIDIGGPDQAKERYMIGDRTRLDRLRRKK